MSQCYVDAVWRSPAPPFLKRGVFGTLAAWATDGGTFNSPPTVRRLTGHCFYNGATLSERSVRYQLRTLERLGVLVTQDPPISGRGWTRSYSLQLPAILALTEAAVMADAVERTARRKGATVAPFLIGNSGGENAGQKGATKGATAAPEGGNKGGNGALVRTIERNVHVKNLRLSPDVDRRTTKETTTTDARLAAKGQLADLLRASLADRAADKRRTARQVAAIARELHSRRGRPWPDRSTFKDNLRRELRRLHIDPPPADVDDAISWVVSNTMLWRVPGDQSISQAS